MHTLRLLVLTAGLVVLAGCGGSPSNTSADTGSASTSKPSHAAKKQTGSSSSAAPTPSGPARCTTKELRVSLTGGEGAAVPGVRCVESAWVTGDEYHGTRSHVLPSQITSVTP